VVWGYRWEIDPTLRIEEGEKAAGGFRMTVSMMQQGSYQIVGDMYQ
jgi:hypothetical protein